MIVAVAWPAGRVGLVGLVQRQMCVLLLLLIGINCSLGLYRSNIKSRMERFRLRATATLLFTFAGMLTWVREGPSVELAIVPLVGAIALVLGSWIEHLIGARSPGPTFTGLRPPFSAPAHAAARSPACC